MRRPTWRAVRKAVSGSLCIEIAIGAGRRIFPPVVGGRPKALHPSAFLIDEHGRILAANGLAEGRGEGFDLGGGFAIALEENEAPGILLAEEGCLSRRQLRAFAPTDEAANFHDDWILGYCLRTRQSRSPAATSELQILVASSRDAMRANGQAEPGAAANGGGIDRRWQGSDDAGVFGFQPAEFGGGFGL